MALTCSGASKLFRSRQPEDSRPRDNRTGLVWFRYVCEQIVNSFPFVFSSARPVSIESRTDFLQSRHVCCCHPNEMREVAISLDFLN